MRDYANADGRKIDRIMRGGVGEFCRHPIVLSGKRFDISAERVEPRPGPGTWSVSYVPDVPNEMQDFQTELGEWADRTFGIRDTDAMLRKLIREVEELRAAPDDVGEMADVGMLYLDYCRLKGHCVDDVLGFMRAKFTINTLHEWVEDEDGNFSRVKRSEDSTYITTENVPRRTIAMQTCDECGISFAVEYCENGSYSFLTETCKCQSSFSPEHGTPSLSQWIESLKEKEEAVDKP